MNSSGLRETTAGRDSERELSAAQRTVGLSSAVLTLSATPGARAADVKPRTLTSRVTPAYERQYARMESKEPADPITPASEVPWDLVDTYS